MSSTEEDIDAIHLEAAKALIQLRDVTKVFLSFMIVQLKKDEKNGLGTDGAVETSEQCLKILQGE